MKADGCRLGSSSSNDNIFWNSFGPSTGPCQSFIGSESVYEEIDQDNTLLLTWNWGPAAWWITLVVWIPYLIVFCFILVPPEDPRSGFVYRS